MGGGCAGVVGGTAGIMRELFSHRVTGCTEEIRGKTGDDLSGWGAGSKRGQEVAMQGHEMKEKENEIYAKMIIDVINGRYDDELIRYGFEAYYGNSEEPKKVARICGFLVTNIKIPETQQPNLKDAFYKAAIENKEFLPVSYEGEKSFLQMAREVLEGKHSKSKVLASFKLKQNENDIARLYIMTTFLLSKTEIQEGDKQRLADSFITAIDDCRWSNIIYLHEPEKPNLNTTFARICSEAVFTTNIKEQFLRKLKLRIEAVAENYPDIGFDNRRKITKKFFDILKYMQAYSEQIDSEKGMPK
jgi:hypothetical protein